MTATATTKVVGHVWIVWEVHDDGRPHYLYGIFDDEATARAEYGEPAPGWTIHVERFPVWGTT